MLAPFDRIILHMCVCVCVHFNPLSFHFNPLSHFPGMLYCILRFSQFWLTDHLAIKKFNYFSQNFYFYLQSHTLTLLEVIWRLYLELAAFLYMCCCVFKLEREIGGEGVEEREERERKSTWQHLTIAVVVSQVAGSSSYRNII